jgi:hypothetical protein
MPWSVDARIPVEVVDALALPAALAKAPPTALLVEAPPPADLPAGAVALVSFEAGAVAHAVGCACCAGRPPIAAALDRLFLARVTGRCAWFDRVLAVAESAGTRHAVAATLAGDALCAARYRLGVT